jgi:hypothetical protein
MGDEEQKKENKVPHRVSFDLVCDSIFIPNKTHIQEDKINFRALYAHK